MAQWLKHLPFKHEDRKENGSPKSHKCQVDMIPLPQFQSQKMVSLDLAV